MHRILLFASGGGSNVAAILRYFKGREDVTFPLLVCNKTDAGVLRRAEEAGVPSMTVDREAFRNAAFVQTLRSHSPSLLVLAGFLWRIPEAVVEAFPRKIINLHPALLPRFGGKGMWGKHVHEAVLSAGETESGITIHYVNERYDEGAVILQARCPVQPADTPEALALRIQRLEHYYLPRAIDALLQSPPVHG